MIVHYHAQKNQISFFVILAGLFFAVPVLAQMQYGLNKDSLKRVISNGKNDTAKVVTLIALGQQYENENPDSALHLYREAGSLSKKINYIPGIVSYISNYTAVLNIQGKFNESLRLNLQAVDLSRKYRLKKELTKSLLNTGAVYQYMEAYGQAVNYYLQALPLVLETKNPQHLSLIYGNLCGLYRNLKRPEKALTYARSALVLARRAGDLHAEASASINYANVLKELKEIGKALQYLLRARQLSRQINDVSLEETALIDMGDAYLQQGNVKQYMKAYREALPMARAINDVSGTAFALHGIALGLYNSRQFANASAFLNDGITYARQHDQKEVLGRMLMLMSDIEITLGNLDRSQQYRAQYDSVTNILLNAPLLKNIQELETKYETEKRKHELILKDRQLEQRELESRRQRQWLIAAAAGLLVLVVVLILAYWLYLQKQQLNRQEQARIKLHSKLEGEQEERRRISQEIHDDLGAGLTRMLFLSRNLSPAAVAGQIGTAAEELIKKMNEVIWMMNDGQDTLAGLVAHIRSTIAELLAQADIDYRFEVQEPVADITLSREIRRHVYLAVKESVHNIIKHADATHVLVSISHTQNLTITIHDNGKGIAENLQHSGNGIRNMHYRMKQLNGSLTVLIKNGTQLQFIIPAFS